MVYEEPIEAHLTDRAATALSDVDRLVLVLEQPVLALERTPACSPLPALVDPLELEEAVPVSCVAGSFLCGSAGLAEGVAAPAAALLEGEVLEGLLLVAVPAALPSLFHQHAPTSTIEVVGKGSDATHRV